MNPDASRTLYLVVHGVGDPSPGQTVREFARGLTFRGEPMTAVDECHWLPEPDPAGGDGRTARVFPVHVLRDDERGTVLAEVHWADLSRFSISLLGVVDGFFGVLFGLRYMAYQAAHGLDAPGAGLLRRLGRWSTGLLIGPIAATNLLLLLLTVAAAVADRIEGGSFGVSPYGDIAGLSACLVAMLVGAGLAGPLGRNQVFRKVGASLLGVAVAVTLAVSFVRGSDFGRKLWEDGPLYKRLAVALGEAARAAHPPIDLPIDLASGGLIPFVAFTNAILVLTFLATNLILLVSVVVFLGVTLGERRASARRSATVATLIPLLMTFGWCFVVPVAWSVVGSILPGSIVFKAILDVLIRSGTIILPFVLIILLCLIVPALAVAGHWLRRRARLGRSAPPRGEPDDGARLILAPWLQWSLAASFLFFEAVTIAGYASVLTGSGEPSWLKWLRDHVGPAAAVALAISVAALPLLLSRTLPYLRSGLDLAYDVINHFHFRFDDVPDARTLTRPDIPEFPVRHAIQRRLSATVAHFAGRLAGPDRPPCHLVILSHSQGTVVAIDVLNDPAHDGAFDRFASVRLVTMGSPFTHIYQHYFRHHYPELKSDDWQTLARRLPMHPDGRPRWTNLYRVDDYVGRVIDASRPGLVENIPVRPRGHLGYFTDRETLRELADRKIL